jgi:DNA-binding transcriptional ArsR family regulator
MAEPIPLPEAAQVFYALGDPTRLRLLLVLSERGEVGVNDLARAVRLSQSGTSSQLACLRRAGLTAYRRDGQRHLYRLASPFAAELLQDVGPG